MITRILFTFSLSLCITGSVAAQGMQRSVIPPSTSIMQAPTSIMPPPTSLFPTPSLQPSVTSGPRWRSAKKNEENLTRQVEDGLIIAGDFSTSAVAGSTIDTIHDASINEAVNLKQAQKEAAKIGREGLAGLDKRYGSNPNPNVKTALDDARRKINAEVDDLGKQADSAAAQGSFLAKLGKVLEILDFVSVAAQGAGYLSVGDRTGAAGVVAGEMTKKLAEGGGALAGSFVPGGSVFGAWAGNKAWEENIKPEIEKREQALREEELRRAVLNKPWLRPKEFIDGTGNVRNLKENQYIDPVSNLVRQRTPEEQAGFERVEYTKWRNDRTWEQINKDYAEGKIDDKRLAALQVSYANRSLVDPWQPLDLNFPIPEEPGQEEAKKEEPSTEELIAEITPVQLTASGSITETFMGTNVVTTFEVGFWNLGAYSPAHSKAVLKITSTHEQAFALVGTFSGGPNGSLKFASDGEEITFQLQNGSYLSGEMEKLINNGTDIETFNLTMPISDPSAFADWPKNLQ